VSEVALTWGIVGAAIAATYLWRGLGVALSVRIDPDSSLFQWVTCVSYAMLAGLIARMIVMPLGELAAVPLTLRLGAMAVAFAVFFASGRRTYPAVVAGVVSFSLLVTFSGVG